MSLYRTYRPQSFADVVGQDHIVSTLEQAAEQGKLAHAFLFAGSRGTGKTSVARILAKVIMSTPIKDEALQRQIIKGVEDGSLVDLLEIDAASNRGIDDVRDLIEKIQFTPTVAAAKVYIIDEVHMLTKEAFNALLKTLEEPPAYAYFILATTELNKIPPTIQSRCQCFPFRRIREEDIVRRLQYIADQERITVDREALRTIAHHVEGGLRDAISLLDQMRSLKKIVVADVEQRIGSTGREYIETVFDALRNRDAETLLKTVKKIEEAGVSTDSFLRQLLGIMREKLHEAVAAKEPIGPITAVLDVLLEAIRDSRIAPVPGLVLESALLSLCDQGERTTKELFTVPAEEEEGKPSKKKPEAAAAKSVPEPAPPPKEEAPTPKKSAIVEARDLSLESLQQAWRDIVEQATPAEVKMSLKNGRLRKLDGAKVTISFASSFHRDTVAKNEASRAVEAVMEKYFKRHLKLECVVDQEETPAPREGGDSVVNLAEAAAEIF